MTIEIVEGQTLDFSFEGRADISADDYLDMISGKTAAIVQFAARAGAVLGGASQDDRIAFTNFGLALGLGYQIRDDALGVWGVADVTGRRPRMTSAAVNRVCRSCSFASESITLD